MLIHGLEFDPPPGFVADESMIALRRPAESPAPPHKQVVLRPNLIVHSKAARAGKSIAELAGEMFAELVRTLGELRDSQSVPMTYADGARGMVLSYELAARPSTLRQLIALRLDGERLTTFTLTVNAEGLTPEQHAAYFTSLTTARIAEVAP